jgi:hypothetical protein
MTPVTEEITTTKIVERVKALTLHAQRDQIAVPANPRQLAAKRRRWSKAAAGSRISAGYDTFVAINSEMVGIYFTQVGPTYGGLS